MPKDDSLVKRNPILRVRTGAFTGVLGFVGTERIGPRETTRDWLQAFNDRHADDGLETYARELGDDLTSAWRRLALASVLEILIGGVVEGDVRFWYVRNSDGLRDDWTYRAPRSEFAVVDDLDRNYIPRDRAPNETKADVSQAGSTHSAKARCFLPRMSSMRSPTFSANCVGLLLTVSSQSTRSRR